MSQMVGDMTLFEIEKSLMLDKNSKFKEVEMVHKDGKVKVKVLFKHGRRTWRLRRELDIEEFQDMTVKEFSAFLWELCLKKGEDRGLNNKERKRRKHGD